MEGLGSKRLEFKFVAFSASGNFCFHLQWTRPMSFIHKTMSSTIMCLLLERIGELDDDIKSNQCADVQYNIVASDSLYAAD